MGITPAITVEGREGREADRAPPVPPGYVSVISAVLSVSLVSAGCGRDSTGIRGPDKDRPTPHGIVTAPRNVLLREAQSVPVQAIVLSANGDTVHGVSVSWSSADAAIVKVEAAGVLTGVSAGETTITASAAGLVTTLAARVLRGANVASLTPPPLKVVLGPLVQREAPAIPPDVASELAQFDQRYLQTEKARFQDYVAVENDNGGAWFLAAHYGGLRGRLAWAIRTGEPYGPGVTDENLYAYARGRRIIRKYLQFSKSSRYLTQAHYNTGLADVEALYTLEVDPDAWAHLHTTAVSVTTDRYNYLKLQNPNSDARQVAVAIQAATTAHRLNIPFASSPANPGVAFDPSPGSWKGVARRLIGWLTEYGGVKPDGSIPSPAHDGQEAFLFNAMLAKELLHYCGAVEWDPAVLELAQRIMDHLIDRYTARDAPRGWSTLGYLSNSGGPAPDLAAFYIWPSLVLWQETGDQKYYDFAVVNLKATKAAYIGGMKQWNQVYNTMAEGAEALFSGQPWR